MTETANPVSGFIGLGSQGAPTAHRLIDAGFETWLWERREVTLAPFRDTHARVAGSVEELGKAVDHLGLCVVSDKDVREMVGHLLPAMRPGSVIAIQSTIRPDTCRALGEEAAARRVDPIDAPVSGGSPAAEAEQLTVMVGGAAAVLEPSRRALESFAGLIVHLGETGAGQYAKLINNSLFVANLGLDDAAMVAGEACGIDRGEPDRTAQSEQRAQLRFGRTPPNKKPGWLSARRCLATEKHRRDWRSAGHRSSRGAATGRCSRRVFRCDRRGNSNMSGNSL